jgi:hypothetical protein
MKKLLALLFAFVGVAASAQVPLPRQPPGTLFANCTGVLAAPSTATFTQCGVPKYLRFGVPVLYPSSGSMANNGVLTLTTATPFVMANTWIYLPAGAISSGSAAGVYYAQCTTTTACTVYNITLPAGTAPYSPGTLTAFSTTGPGAYTQTTGTTISLTSISIPGGTLGPTGAMGIMWYGLRPNNADAVTTTLTFGGNTFAIVSSASANWYGAARMIKNISLGTTQWVLDPTTSNSSDIGFGTTAPGAFTVNTNVAQSLGFTVNLATATDYYILTDATIEVYHAD